ncbi:DUF2325 domain-containing protein [Stella sp.]|uniref:DUF2325 domain-containing protein n=1 Tax=Stella sp. TaxID=2912054 RepID=UPI0035AE46BB
MKPQSVIDFPTLRSPAPGGLAGLGGALRLRAAAPPLVVGRAEAQPAGRRRIWQLSAMLHCSIIGTCLSTAELRQLLGKAGHATGGLGEHDLHREGVGAAGRHDGVARLINKALDRRHHLAVQQFGRVSGEAEVRRLWSEFVQRGEIPGAYWAALTHPDTGDGLIRQIFGEVHMLSHLVGAANRADVRRLAELEAELAQARDKLVRQQDRLREATVGRDARIRELQALAARAVADAAPAIDPASELATLRRLVGDLGRRLGLEAARREQAEAASAEARRAQAVAAGALRAAATRERAMQAELDAVEARLAPATDPADPASAVADARIFLYVGGRPEQVPRLRALAGRAGAELLHHDGGVEDRGGLLAGLVARADLVLFPVDCVSHASVEAVKRHCRQMGKPFRPLRGAGLAPFLAVLGAA